MKTKTMGIIVVWVSVATITLGVAHMFRGTSREMLLSFGLGVLAMIIGLVCTVAMVDVAARETTPATRDQEQGDPR